VIRLRRVGSMLPLLEAILNGFGLRPQPPGSSSAAILDARPSEAALNQGRPARDIVTQG